MPSEPHSVTTFEPVADMAIVHHMLVFGCREKEPSKTLEKIRVGGGMFSTGKEESATKNAEPRGDVCANNEQEAVLFLSLIHI